LHSPRTRLPSSLRIGPVQVGQNFFNGAKQAVQVHPVKTDLLRRAELVVVLAQPFNEVASRLRQRPP